MVVLKPPERQEDDPPREKRVVGKTKWSVCVWGGRVCNSLFLLCGLRPGYPSQEPEFPLVWWSMKGPKDLVEAESQLNDNICYEFFVELRRYGLIATRCPNHRLGM